MIAWLLFNIMEIVTLSVAGHRSFTSSLLGKATCRVVTMTFDVLDTVLAATITSIIQFVSAGIGKPSRRNKPSYQKRASNRRYSMRSIPWKKGAMKKISLLAFATNTIGAAKMRTHFQKGQVHGVFAFLTRSTKKQSKQLRFDTDSFMIKVDNCCTCCISPDIGDFVGPVETVTDKAVQSFNGQMTKVKHKGTIRWTINDDQGIAREIIIPNSYHIPESPHQMLSPQHWAQQANDNFPDPRGT
jgi:hypothetical protein